MKDSNPNDIEVVGETNGSTMTANEIKDRVSKILGKDLSNWIFRFVPEGLEFYLEKGKEFIYDESQNDFSEDDILEIARVLKHYV